MNRFMLSLSFPILACLWLIPDEGVCQSGSRADNPLTLENLSASLADLAQRVRPSVVQIRTVGYGTAEGQDVGLVSSQQGTGSGVILDREGFIVTNAHIVKNARHIEVWLNATNMQQGAGTAEPPKQRSVSASLVGIDLDMDLAVIKIDRSGLYQLLFADSDSLWQGQIVLAAGNPMALENSVTMGVISSVNRQLKPEDLCVYIQTDAPINPGSSGGPLIDVQGRLVGINTFILSESGGSEGIGFAIPGNVVKRVYSEIRKAGHAHHGVINALSITVTPSLAAGLQLPRDWGVILEDVKPGGPSDKAGLKPGDLVTAVDGVIIRDKPQFLVAIDKHSIGDTMHMVVLRGSQKISAAVTVLERDDDPNRFMELVNENANLVGRLGILAIDLNQQLLKMVPAERKPARIVVAARVAGLPGSEAGLAVGDLIISLNGKAIPNVATLRADLGKLPSGSPVVFQIQRGDQLRFIVLDLP